MQSNSSWYFDCCELVPCGRTAVLVVFRYQEIPWTIHSTGTVKIRFTYCPALRHSRRQSKRLCLCVGQRMRLNGARMLWPVAAQLGTYLLIYLRAKYNNEVQQINRGPQPTKRPLWYRKRFIVARRIRVHRDRSEWNDSDLIAYIWSTPPRRLCFHQR